MGEFQDLVIWIRRQFGKLTSGKAKHFKFNKEHKWVRYPVLILTIAAIAAGLQVVVAIIGPYSAYGRIVRTAVGLDKGESLIPALLITAAVRASSA